MPIKSTIDSNFLFFFSKELDLPPSKGTENGKIVTETINIESDDEDTTMAETIKSPPASKNDEKSKSTKKTAEETNGATASDTSNKSTTKLSIPVPNSDDEDSSTNSTKRNEKNKSVNVESGTDHDSDHDSDDSNKTTSTVRLDQQDILTSTKIDTPKKRSPKRKLVENGDDGKIPRKRSKYGLDAGRKAEKILGATDMNGQVEFMVKYKNYSPVEMVPAKIANLKCPQIGKCKQ